MANVWQMYGICMAFTNFYVKKYGKCMAFTNFYVKKYGKCMAFTNFYVKNVWQMYGKSAFVGSHFFI